MKKLRSTIEFTKELELILLECQQSIQEALREHEEEIRSTMDEFRRSLSSPE